MLPRRAGKRNHAQRSRSEPSFSERRLTEMSLQSCNLRRARVRGRNPTRLFSPVGMGRLACQEDVAMWRRKLLASVFLAAVALTAGFVRAAYDDDDDEEGPGPTTVNKNGFEV